MSVSKEEVNYIAGLAKLHLSEKEVEVLSRDMNNILSASPLLDDWGAHVHSCPVGY